MLHGPYGEDGTIQGLLELANVPYVGAGVAASAHRHGQGADEGRVLGARPAVVRLAAWCCGTSGSGAADDILGEPRARARLSDVRQAGEPRIERRHLKGQGPGVDLRTAIDLAGSFDRKVVVEAAVPDAREIECGVLGNDTPEASVPGEVIPVARVLRLRSEVPRRRLEDGDPGGHLPPATAEEIRRLSIAAFQAIDCAGMARVDFLLVAPDGRRSC